MNVSRVLFCFMFSRIVQKYLGHLPCVLCIIYTLQQPFGYRMSHDANTRMIILGDDGLRSQYVPPKPMVKILKRPTREGNGDGPLNDDKPKQPIKSLKQVCNYVARPILSNI